MTVRSIYPVLVVEDVAATVDFFRRHLGFSTTFEAEWYVSLVLDRWELAILQVGHPTIPADHRDRRASGVLVNIEVDDVDALYRELVDAGVPVLLPLRSEDFGQRHAIVAAPGDVMVDIITPIPPTGEFAD